MPKHHEDLELVAGDDWTIVGQLLDEDGSALDLTNATLAWALRDPDGDLMDDAINAVNLTVQSPATSGVVNIVVPYTVTSYMTAGRYHDAIRVTIGFRSLLWIGVILVDADPWEFDD